jgi:hypothetical protein
MMGKKQVIKKRKEIDEKQALKLCVKDGVVDIDKLIKIDNFDFYEKIINSYPATKYEKLYIYLNNKDYKKLFNYFAFEDKDEKILNLFRVKKLSDLEKQIDEYIKLSLRKSNGYFKENTKYFKNKKRHNRVEVRDVALSSNTYLIIIEKKNQIFLSDILNNEDERFFEKALKTATQKEKDWALEEIIKLRPESYEIQKILLDADAKLHKRWTEDDGWGYSDLIDKIDDVGTNLLKNQIKLFLDKGEN